MEQQLATMTFSERDAFYLEQIKELKKIKQKIDLVEEILVDLKENQITYLVEHFTSSKCVVEPTAKVEAKQIYIHFNLWVSDKNYPISLGNRTFYSILESLGFLIKRGSRNKVFVYGLKLKDK